MVAFLFWQCGSALLEGRKLSNLAVQHFHEEMNGAEYAQIVDEADEGFRHSGMTRDQLMKFLNAIHARMGNAGNSNLRNIEVQANTGGTFVITVYRTKFDRGDAVETFTWLKKNGELLLYDYKIESNALVM